MFGSTFPTFLSKLVVVWTHAASQWIATLVDNASHVVDDTRRAFSQIF